MTAQWYLKALVLFVVLLAADIQVGAAYEVWLTDQSDTGKESGGYLYIYDGAQLAANASSAKPSLTIDFSGDLGKFCEEATKKTRSSASHAVFQRQAGSCAYLIPQWSCAVLRRSDQET
jgi:hypothetical protein